MAGWSLTASGNADDPRDHHELLARLRTVLSEHTFGTGSSEFNSAHVADQNFHLPAAPSTQPAASAPAGGSGGTVASPGPDGGAGASY